MDTKYKTNGTHWNYFYTQLENFKENRIKIYQRRLAFERKYQKRTFKYF